jgi:hypothetical protein
LYENFRSGIYRAVSATAFFLLRLSTCSNTFVPLFNLIALRKQCGVRRTSGGVAERALLAAFVEWRAVGPGGDERGGRRGGPVVVRLARRRGRRHRALRPRTRARRRRAHVPRLTQPHIHLTPQNITQNCMICPIAI